MSLSPKYTFLSWYRQGLATYIQQVDDPNTTGAVSALTFGIELQEKAGRTESITQTMPLAGPENVAGIRPEAIIETIPLDNSTTHVASHLASIAFYDEDFPWRYTPAAPFQNKLRPWLWLLVLEEGEGIVAHHSSRPLPYVTLEPTLADGTPNPALQIPAEEAWSWAHVQVNQHLDTTTTDLPTALKVALDNNPDVAFSRIISPRRLKAGTNYQAFLVPFFERGRLAGLGEDTTVANLLDAAWTPNDLDSTSKDFPFYYEWSFTTSIEGDFETLARKLQPQELNTLPLTTANVEKTLVHFQDSITANDASKVVELPSALMPVGQEAEAWPAINSVADAAIQAAVQQDLNPVVDTTASTSVTNVATANMQGDIVVNIPPVYGKWHLDQGAWQSTNGNLDANNSGWIHQLNTDVRARALAGLGVQVVREHQEQFMTEAWAQVGEIIATNRAINQTLVARETSYQLHKRLKNASRDTTIAATGSLHQRILHDNNGQAPANTVKQEILGSNLSVAPTNSAFVKLRRPSSKAIKKLKKQAGNYVTTIDPNQNFVTNINQTTLEGINGAPLKPSPYAVLGTANPANTTPSNSTAVDDLSAHLNTLGASPPMPVDLATHETVVQEAINPLFTLEKRLLDKLQLPDTSNSDLVLQQPSDKLKPVLAAPEIKWPLYTYLKDIAQQFILPSLATYGDNFVGLMRVNQVFIEQFLLGANHEMGRELLWRGYPTDQRGSYFRQFWNVKDHIQKGQGQVSYRDISPIHTWGSNSSLGTHRPNGYPNIPTVLILKGELLRANPDLVVYAHQAVSNPLLHTDTQARPKKVLNPTENNTTVKYPIFRAELAPDVMALGFDLDTAVAKGDATNKGWFFILKERPGKVKLGLDEGAAIPMQLASYNDLHWQHMPTTQGGVSYISPTQTLSFTDGTTPQLASSAAQLAERLYQAPLMLGLHAARLLP